MGLSKKVQMKKVITELVSQIILLTKLPNNSVVKSQSDIATQRGRLK